MRVLIATQAEKTHFLGMVPLAWALRTAGHEVRVASQPALAEVIASTGLTAVPVGRDHMFHHLLRSAKSLGLDEDPGFDMAEERGEVLTYEHLTRGVGQFVTWWWKVVNEPMLDDLVGFCRTWRPDLVVWEPTTFAGAVAAQACGAAHARQMWGADLFGRMRGLHLRLMAGREPAERRDPLREWLAAAAGRFGGEFAEELTCGQATVDHLPGSIRLDTGLPLLPMRYVPYNGRAVVPAWLREPPSRPRVCVTLGGSAPERLDGRGLGAQDMLDSMAGLDVEVVATLPARERAKLARVPDNARIVEFAPLHALLPTCTAVAHHGGAGTYATAMLYGVPQLIVPQLVTAQYLFDERTLGERLAEQGAGAVLTGDVTAERVSAALARLLTGGEAGQQARRLRAEMLAMPDVHAVVAELEKAVSSRRGRSVYGP
ncbi:glycosyltransferase, activator-dependent family [Sinosporangium album]|uniref:Glycosyltransferase, activator-dependent family n=1 Tax=Sinosporangium album TaxID=504805 RepID=A0A1G8GHW4_9ACTN|nr:activator-dependent family glycosyltransferase [Sinosporangium album]SDH94009.1 glycosyltransferase, activator-dependent family [Sinosporangium album]